MGTRGFYCSPVPQATFNTVSRPPVVVPVQTLVGVGCDADVVAGGTNACGTLDRALDGLAVADARKAKVVELRFFGGLSVQETSDLLHVSNDTIKRDWRLAKLWLLRELEGKRDE